MIYDVETFDDIIKLPIRPQAQFYLQDSSHYVGGYVVAGNVYNYDLSLDSYRIAPNPNNLRGAALSENGYRVDDPNLRVMNSLNYCNLMFYSYLFTDVIRTRRLLYYIQHVTEDAVTMTITIGPIYKGSFRFDWIEYNVDTDEILSTQSATLTATEDYEVLEFDTNPTTTTTAYKLMATALDADADFCIINFGGPEIKGISRYIIDNSNLIQFNSDEHADLYSQSRSSFDYTVEFLDINHLYDPQNPKGKFASLILGTVYMIFMGYTINGMFVNATTLSGNTTAREGCLKDLPIWDNQKVKLHLADRHTFDSNLTTQVPHIGNYSDDVTPKKFAPNDVNYSKQVLTQMTYKIRYVVGPYSYGNPVYMTIADDAKKVMETTGYLHSDCPIEDVYTLAQNALGCWNYGKNVSDISVADMRDYTIDDTVIYNQVLTFNKEPALKALTIKKYNNVKITTPIVYTITLTAADFEYYSPGARPYRAELKTDNPLTNIVSMTVSSSNPNDWVWTKPYERDFISGLCGWHVYVYAVNPAQGAGTYTLSLYPIETTTEDVSEVVNEEGENLTIDNPFITSDALVNLCATAAKRIAAWREVYDIDVMENFKLRVGDIVKLDTMYEKGIPVIITGLQFNIPGPKGHITCRRIS